jgi:uncharacterized protein YndB with AHSA1/START domain
MPKHKDLKRLIRGRMQKTGESYTTARLHILQSNGVLKGPITKTPTAKAPAVKTLSQEPPPNYAAITRMSDESVRKATGCTWERWVKALDRDQAFQMSHREIAVHIHQKYKTPSWWTQMVTVGYERIRGLREVGQKRGGEYEISKSKTIAVPLRKPYAAFSSPRARARWLAGVKLTVRSATPQKAMRLRWDDDTPVEVTFASRGKAKSQVAVQHGKLPTKSDAERKKAFWAERLEALAAVVTI